MNRIQFWALNITSLLLVVLLLSHFFFARANSLLSGEVAREQAFINNARQVETVLDQLAKRIARGSDTDPQLKNILIKHGLNVTLEIEGKQKAYP